MLLDAAFGFCEMDRAEGPLQAIWRFRAAPCS